MASDNWHDHDNAFGYRHEVQPQKVAGGAFAFVGFVVAGVWLLFRGRTKRRALMRPAPMTPQQVSALIVAEAVKAAAAEYVERTGAVPERRDWFSLGS